MRHPRRMTFVVCSAMLALFCVASDGGAFEITSIGKRQPQAAPQGWEMRCRGGGTVPLQFATLKKNALPTGETAVEVQIRFKAAASGAGPLSEGLQPGTCAFIDRTLNAQEYPEIWFKTVANSQLKQILHDSPVDTSPAAAESHPDAITIPRYLEDPNHYWSFFGNYESHGTFQASSHNVWKRSADGELKGQPLVGGLVLEKKRDRQPRNSIRVLVRYRKSYGVGVSAGAFGPDPSGCFDFLPRITPSMVGNTLIATPNSGRRSETADQYVCEYLFTALPFDVPFIIGAGVFEKTKPWSGGNEPAPPPGQQRTIIGGSPIVTLTTSAPTATVSFDMVYAPPPTTPR